MNKIDTQKTDNATLQSPWKKTAILLTRSVMVAQLKRDTFGLGVVCVEEMETIGCRSSSAALSPSVLSQKRLHRKSVV